MGKSRNELFENIKIDEIGMMELITDLCLEPDSFLNRDLIKAALIGTYAGKGILTQIKLENALAEAGYSRLNERACNLAYVHEQSAKPVVKGEGKAVFMAKLQRGDFVGAKEMVSMQASFFDDNTGIFGKRAKQAEKEKGRELTMGEMAEMGLFESSKNRRR